MRDAFVVSYSPTYTGIAGVGGFDWFWDRTDAVARLLEHISDQHSNITLCVVPVPEDLTGYEVTAYLDARSLWFEPALPAGPHN